MIYVYPELNLEDIIEYNTLLQWNYKYPPTKYEKLRNKKIHKIQGNINPFISNYRLMKRYL